MKIRDLTHLIETLRQVFDHTSEPLEMTVYHLAPGVTLQRVQNKDLAWEHLNPQCRDDWQICDRTEPGIVRRVTVRTSTGEATLDTVLAQAFKASPDPQNMTPTEHQIPKSMRTPGLAALVRDALRAGLHVDGTERGLRIHGKGRDLVVSPNGWAHDPRVDSRVAKSIRAHADMRRALGLPQAPQNTL